MGRARVQMGRSKSNIALRLQSWTTVRQKAKDSPLYASSPAVKAQVQEVIARGQELSDADQTILKLEADLDHARATRAAKAQAYDLAYTSLASVAEAATTEPADLLALGFEVREAGVVPLTPPTEVSVTSAPGTGVIEIAISGKPDASYAIEVTADPEGKTGYERLPGTGPFRDVGGQATGLHWVRAALQKARAQSEWSAAYPVLVR